MVILSFKSSQWKLPWRSQQAYGFCIWRACFIKRGNVSRVFFKSFSAAVVITDVTDWRFTFYIFYVMQVLFSTNVPLYPSRLCSQRPITIFFFFWHLTVTSSLVAHLEGVKALGFGLVVGLGNKTQKTQFETLPIGKAFFWSWNGIRLFLSWWVFYDFQ